MLRRSFLGLAALLPFVRKVKAESAIQPIEIVGSPIGGSYTLTIASDPSYSETYTWDKRAGKFVRVRN